MRNMVILSILVYRLIPSQVRSIWTAPGGGSSGKALNALRNGKGITETLRRFALPRPGMRGLSWNDFEVSHFGVDLYWFIPED